jgi:hypothetical protein
MLTAAKGLRLSYQATISTIWLLFGVPLGVLISPALEATAGSDGDCALKWLALRLLLLGCLLYVLPFQVMSARSGRRLLGTPFRFCIATALALVLPPVVETVERFLRMHMYLWASWTMLPVLHCIIDFGFTRLMRNIRPRECEKQAAQFIGLNCLFFIPLLFAMAAAFASNWKLATACAVSVPVLVSTLHCHSLFFRYVVARCWRDEPKLVNILEKIQPYTDVVSHADVRDYIFWYGDASALPLSAWVYLRRQTILSAAARFPIHALMLIRILEVLREDMDDAAFVAAINHQCPYLGHTALQAAAVGDNVPGLQLLLLHHADASLTFFDGRTAMDFCLRCGRWEPDVPQPSARAVLEDHLRWKVKGDWIAACVL